MATGADAWMAETSFADMVGNFLCLQLQCDGPCLPVQPHDVGMMSTSLVGSCDVISLSVLLRHSAASTCSTGISSVWELTNPH